MTKRGVTGHTAVMAQRAPREVASDDSKRRLWRQLDFYPTPPWAARAGAEIIKRLDPSAKTVWEPAAGQGHMAEALGEYFDVTVSDVHDYGYCGVIDFLSDDAQRLAGPAHDWIVTNPPFENGGRFVSLGLERARRGVAMLCRLAFLESIQRYSLMQRLTLLAPFSERVPMQLGSWDPMLSSATAYAWFVWDKHAPGARQIEFVPPGSKAMLWRDTDVERFSVRGEAPLLDGAAP